MQHVRLSFREHALSARSTTPFRTAPTITPANPTRTRRPFPVDTLMSIGGVEAAAVSAAKCHEMVIMVTAELMV